MMATVTSDMTAALQKLQQQPQSIATSRPYGRRPIEELVVNLSLDEGKYLWETDLQKRSAPDCEEEYEVAQDNVEDEMPTTTRERFKLPGIDQKVHVSTYFGSKGYLKAIVSQAIPNRDT